jgi:hypothetical protein
MRTLAQMNGERSTSEIATTQPRRMVFDAWLIFITVEDGNYHSGNIGVV